MKNKIIGMLISISIFFVIIIFTENGIPDIFEWSSVERGLFGLTLLFFIGVGYVMGSTYNKQEEKIQE